MTGPTASTGSAASTPSRRGGGPPLVIAGLAIGSLVLGALLIAVQALGLGTGANAAPTRAPTGEAAQLTHDLIVKALGDASFQVHDPPNDFRPGESPQLYSVPRGLVQVILPSEPKGEYVVIYELSSANEADRVGRDFAAYLAGGTGAVQYPRDSRFVIQRLGSTLVFFPWSPSVSPDPRVAELAAVLDMIGTPILP
jgi:hypothetical protein